MVPVANGTSAVTIAHCFSVSMIISISVTISITISFFMTMNLMISAEEVYRASRGISRGLLCSSSLVGIQPIPRKLYLQSSSRRDGTSRLGGDS